MKIPDLLAPNLRLVIVGTAVGNRSAGRQAYYARSGNRFWKTLHKVGLTPRELAPNEYPLLLDHGIGLTDLVKGKSGMDHVLADEDFDPDGLEAKIREFRPQVVCLHGKKAAQAYFGRRKVDYGLQQDNHIPWVRFFVVPQASGANGHWDRLVGWWGELATFLLILRLATELRQALEDCPKSDLPVTLSLFPSGACGDAALLLAWHLTQNGISDAQYVCGIRNGRSHAWLLVNGLLVDITADQFSEGLPQVFVEISSKWHDRFVERDIHCANLLEYDRHTQARLLSAYQRIVSLLH